jgi:hypothetical protein
MLPRHGFWRQIDWAQSAMSQRLPWRWDLAKGREMYDAGEPYWKIAQECKTTVAAVYHQAMRYWGRRHSTNHGGAKPPSWDTVKGRELWDLGWPRGQIAEACQTTKNAIIGHANRHWPKRPVDPNGPQKNFHTSKKELVNAA